MERETVILTTLSMSTSRKNYSYYYFEKDGKRLYCDGLLSVEAGTKYYMSQYGVDRIVVIASKETQEAQIGQKTVSADKRLLEGRSLARISSFKQASTDADLFFERISFFWNGFQTKDFGKEIDGIRKRELISITRKVLQSKGVRNPKSEWFDAICRNGLYPAISAAVKTDIEQAFLKEADYQRYSDSAWKEAELDFQEKMDRRISADDFFAWIEKNEKKLSWLAKEAFCRIYQDRLNQWLAEADLHSAEAANTMRERAIQYRDAILRLTEEINVLKTNRLQRELAYLQRTLYIALAPDLKLSRLDVAEENAPIITVVSDQDVYEIIRHIRGSETADIRLLIDVQGGNRTSSYEMNSLLSILKNYESIDCSFCAVDFNVRNYANKIQDETQRYSIADLVAAMNAFITYGRAKQFQKYCEKSIAKKEPDVNPLLNEMTKLEESLTLCNVSGIKDALRNIKRLFADRNAVGKTFQDAYLRTLQDGIERDYRDIIITPDESIDLESLIGWTIKKGFFQQAITLAEALIPNEIVRCGILYYADTPETRNKAKKMFAEKLRDTDERERWKFRDLDYYFIKCYCIPSVLRAAFEKANPKRLSKDNKPLKNDPSILLSLLDKNNNATFTQISDLMNRYRDICDLRNTIAHASGETVSSGMLKKKMDGFWKAFRKCKQWADKNSKTILFLKYEEIANSQNRR